MFRLSRRLSLTTANLRATVEHIYHERNSASSTLSTSREIWVPLQGCITRAFLVRVQGFLILAVLPTSGTYSCFIPDHSHCSQTACHSNLLPLCLLYLDTAVLTCRPIPTPKANPSPSNTPPRCLKCKINRRGRGACFEVVKGKEMCVRRNVVARQAESNKDWRLEYVLGEDSVSQTQ